MNSVLAPLLAGSRRRARQLFEDEPADLSGQTVTVDCAIVLASTPSFVDEVLIEAIRVRKADWVIFLDPSDDMEKDLWTRVESKGFDGRARVVRTSRSHARELGT